MNTRAEAAVKRLAKLPGNTTCANCGAMRRHGFSTVCIKYLTFVCDFCKSSHQSISHRCKSITMSTWTDGEVLALKKHGNDYARTVWLANAPPVGTAGRPKEGDDISVFKRFIVDVYENKRYYSDSCSNHSSPGLSGDDEPDIPDPEEPIRNVPTHRWKAPISGSEISHKNMQTTLQASNRPKGSVEPVIDLLDFGVFDDLSTKVNPTTTLSQDLFIDFLSVSSGIKSSNETFDLFEITKKREDHQPRHEEEFGDFTQAKTTPSTSTTPSFASFDPFSKVMHPSDGKDTLLSTTANPTGSTKVSYDPFSITNQNFPVSNGSSQAISPSAMYATSINGTNHFGNMNNSFSGMYQNNIQISEPMHSRNDNFQLHQAYYPNQSFNKPMQPMYGVPNGDIMQNSSAKTHQGYKISGSFMSPSIHSYEEKKADPFQGLGL